MYQNSLTRRASQRGSGSPLPSLPSLARRVSVASSRRGVTILELLVVLLILLMVTAAAIPIVVPAMQNRQMRESARLVSSYFAIARSRAIETGRPVGVVVERFNGQPFGMVLSQVEVPPPYSGDVENSRITVDSMAMPGKITGFVFGDAGWKGLVRYGDQVKLDFRGPTYILASVSPVPMTGDPEAGKAVLADPMTIDWFLVTQTGQPPPFIPPTYDVPPGTGVPFQIIRQPTRSATAPLQLPEGIVVDLTCSGMGAVGSFMAAASFGVPDVMTGSPPPYPPPIVAYDPVIMFSPSGRLEAVSQGDLGRLAHPTDAVYLLLGRRDLMFDAAQRNQPADVVDQNLSPIPNPPTVTPAPPPHFWVSIGYQTGLVTVAEVASNLQNYQPMPAKQLTNVITDALPFAREFARQSQSVGGR